MISDFKNYSTFFLMIAVTIMLFSSFSTRAAESSQVQNARVDTSSTGLTSKVAPGDFLPIAIKLLNFGGGKKVDVQVTYIIIDGENNEIYSYTETVAVETTASFIRNIQIPFQTPPGIYKAKASITYKDQVVPAITEFSFTVEKKILGLFQRELMIYGSVTVFTGIFMGILGHVLVKRYRVSRLKSIDYTDIPRNERIFYEMISDAILQIRGRVGDIALDIAGDIDGLTIDKNTGRVLKILDSPSKIIALLVAEYEKTLDQKVSFSFRKNEVTKKK